MRLCIIIYFIATLFVIIKTNSPLDCKVNQTLIANVIESLSQDGYDIQIGAFVVNCGVTYLAANQGGAYGTYIRPIYNEHKDNLTYVYKMGAQTAILNYGCTPPSSAYFSWRTQVYDNNPEWVWANLGNSLNQFTIKTLQNTQSTPFDDNTIIITTADNKTYNDIANKFQQNGINKNKINLDHVASQLITMGINSNNVSDLVTVFRIGIPFNMTTYNYYCNNDTKLIYIISKGNETNQSIPRQEIPITQLRNRTDPNYNEILMLNNSYQQLVNNIINIMLNEYNYKYINKSIIYGEEFNGFNCIKNNSLCAGNSDDCLYFQDYNNYPFFIKDKNGQNELNTNIKGHILNDNNLYILIGINHYLLNGSVYDEQTLYDQTFNAIHTNVNKSAVLNNFQYINSSNAFNINTSIKYIQYFFSIIISRKESYCENLNNKGVPCLVIPYNSLAENIGFILFNRAYVNPQTKTGPSKTQMLPQYLIYFQTNSEEN